MNNKTYLKTLIICFALGILADGLNAQGTFVNLDFEGALVPDTPPGSNGGGVSASIALPGWVAIPGEFGQVFHNVTLLGSPSIVLYGPNWNQSDIFQGKYTVLLASAFSNSGSALAQTGQIPANAQAMLFYARVFNMQVSFAGNSLPFSRLGSGPNYDIFGVDVTALHGMTGELRFTALPLEGGGVGGVRLDNIQFSNQPIPEPSVFGLFALGAVLLGWRYLRGRLFSRSCLKSNPKP